MNIIYITAYKDIGRKNFKGFERDDDDYINYFKNLIKHHINIICFCEDNIRLRLKEELNFTHCLPYDDNNTFFKYKNDVDKIINDTKFKNIVKHRKDPECFSGDYNIVNHNKIIFVERIYKLYPNYDYYVWIDFGYQRTLKPIINFNYNILKSGVTIGISPIKNIIKTPLEHIINPIECIRGGIFFVSNDKVCLFVKLWKETFNNYLMNNIIDDDQAVLNQIWKNNPLLFNTIETDWFDLLENNFKENNYFDIVTLTCEKDLSTISIAVERAKKYIENIRYCYVICNSKIKDKIPKNCIFIDEDTFDFDYIKLKKLSRYGWYLQQFLKLFCFKYINNLSENFIILDCETLYCNKFSFISNDYKTKFFLSNEVTPNYRNYIKKVLPDIKLQKYSGITHNMLFQKYILNSLFNYLEKTHNKHAFDILYDAIEENNLVLSEYDLYFNYAIDKFSYNTTYTFDLWDISGKILDNTNDIFITAHYHLRNHDIEKHTYNIIENYTNTNTNNILYFVSIFIFIIIAVIFIYFIYKRYYKKYNKNL